MTGRRPAHLHPDTSAAQASIPQPFTTDYEIRVDIPYGGYVETGLTVDIAAYATDGYTLEITGVSATESNAAYYFGDDLEYRLTPTDVAVIENVTAGDNLARRVHTTTYNPDAEYEFPIKNHLGSTMMTFNEDDTVAVSMYDDLPYGRQKKVEEVASARTARTSTGKELDLYDGEGRCYFGKRYYDGDVGLWTSTDPARQFWSAYCYTGNGINPIIGIDKSGAVITIDRSLAQSSEFQTAWNLYKSTPEGARITNVLDRKGWDVNIDNMKLSEGRGTTYPQSETKTNRIIWINLNTKELNNDGTEQYVRTLLDETIHAKDLIQDPDALQKLNTPVQEGIKPSNKLEQQGHDEKHNLWGRIRERLFGQNE